MAAQCGVYVPPSTPAAATRSPASAAVSSARSAEPNPYSLASATSAVARSSCAGDRASCTVPPLAQWQSMPSAVTAAATSSTVCCIARCMAIAASRPAIRASLPSDAGNSAEHQPPLRPDAPNPAISRSQTAIRRPGSARAR